MPTIYEEYAELKRTQSETLRRMSALIVEIGEDMGEERSRYVEGIGIFQRAPRTNLHKATVLFKPHRSHTKD